MKLKTENLNVVLNNKLVLENINLSIPTKKVTAFIGPSGCGKTTLLKSFNRINELNPECITTGKIYFNSANIYQKNYKLESLRRKIGMVVQNPHPFPMSIYENIVFGLRANNIKNKRVLDDTVEYTLRKTFLWEEVKHKLQSSAILLSSGQKQRLIIARAIANSPEVLLLDEPTSSLDPISTLKIEELIDELKTEYTILIVTHNMHQAARISDFTALIYNGYVVEYDLTDNLFTNPKNKLTEAYLTGRYG